MDKVFLDANIILDLIDKDRKAPKSKEKIAQFIKNGDDLYTSCDIFTTLYYVASKKLTSQEIISELEKILTFVEIVPIDIAIINKAIEIAKTNPKHDLEDVLQYVCAKSANCTLIFTNDKGFYCGEIEIMSA